MTEAATSTVNMEQQADDLVMWTVTDHPSDYPNCYVARKTLVRSGVADPIMTNDIVLSPDLEGLERMLANQGMVKLMRAPEDDPVIVGVWL